MDENGTAMGILAAAYVSPQTWGILIGLHNGTEDAATRSRGGVQYIIYLRAVLLFVSLLI